MGGSWWCQDVEVERRTWAWPRIWTQVADKAAPAQGEGRAGASWEAMLSVFWMHWSWGALRVPGWGERHDVTEQWALWRWRGGRQSADADSEGGSARCSLRPGADGTAQASLWLAKGLELKNVHGTKNGKELLLRYDELAKRATQGTSQKSVCPPLCKWGLRGAKAVEGQSANSLKTFSSHSDEEVTGSSSWEI